MALVPLEPRVCVRGLFRAGDFCRVHLHSPLRGVSLWGWVQGCRVCASVLWTWNVDPLGSFALNGLHGFCREGVVLQTFGTIVRSV